MKKISLSLIMLFLLTAVSLQAGWNASLITGENLRGLDHVSGTNTAFICGQTGIYKSTNNGTNWNFHQVAQNVFLYSLAFPDVNSGYAFGANGALYKTTNGGAAWSAQTSGTIETLQSGYFVNSFTGVIVGTGGKIIRTNDGGANWASISSQTNITLVSVHFGSQNAGIAVGRSGKILRTTNGGTMWDPVISSVTANLNSVYMVDGQTAYIAGDNGIILKSTDAGASWSQMATPLNQNLSSIHFTTDISKGFAVGNDGTILFTTNAGESWIIQNPQLSDNLNAVAFADANIGFISADNGKVLTTDDAGAGTIPEIILTSFNSGAKYKAVSQEMITWQSYIIDNVKIEYSSDAGQSWNTVINQIAAATGQYEWTLPANTGANYLIRISDVTDPSVNDQSEITFTIASLEFSSPLPGEKLVIGDNFLFEWNAAQVQNVDIDYSTDAGQNWINITSGVNASPGQYLWQVPAITPMPATFRISDSQNEDFNDIISTEFSYPQSITIIDPDSSGILRSGATFEIIWEAVSVDSLSIEYRINNSSPWISISSSYHAPAETYSWTVPDIKSDSVQLRLRDISNSLITEISDMFSITNEVITLSSPNGGEIWYSGEDRQIKWSSQNISKVDILLSKDAGQSWMQIITGINALTGEYNWNVGNHPSAEALIQVRSSANSSISDRSADEFTLGGIDLTSPDGGESYMAGEDVTIEWLSEEVQDVRVQYSDDNGDSWKLIKDSHPADIGFYGWQLPSDPSTEVLVKVTDTQKSSLYDISSSTFSINGLKLDYPSGGESLLAGSQAEIQWKAVNTGSIKIEFSDDDALSWVTVISSVPASDGSYSWLVPVNESDECFIRLTDLSDPNLQSMNDKSFSIAGKGIVLLSPNGGEDFDTGTQEAIQWTSVNIKQVNIDYSSDKGSTWVRVVSSLDASTGSYNWTIPDSPGTEYLVRITDSENEEVTDQSNEVFKISGSAYQVPSSWNFVTHTGSSSVIVIPASINPKIGTRDFQNGDAVGIFYNSGHGMECAGYAVWNGSDNLSVTVWGDNARTNEVKEGFDENEKYSLRIWDAVAGVEISATAKYSSGFDYFTDNGISIVSELLSYKELLIELGGKRWQMISSNLEQSVTDIAQIMAPVEDNLDMMKNQAGEVYIPYENVNSIINWNKRHGYQIIMKEDDELSLRGVSVKPHQTAITLERLKWHIIPYLPQHSMAAETALANLGTRLTLIKDSEGRVFFPSYNIRQLQTLHPGEGYKITVNSTTSLVYPQSSPSTILQHEPAPSTIPVTGPYHFTDEYTNTGNNCTVVFESREISSSGEVGIFTSDGMPAGSGIYSDGRAVITVWGDDPLTSAKDGLFPGENMMIRYYSYSDDSEYEIADMNVKDLLTGESLKEFSYRADDVVLVRSETLTGIEENTQIMNLKLMPNPAVDYVSGRISSNYSAESALELIDRLGNVLVRKNFTGKYFTLDVADLASGCYTVRINAGEIVFTNKLIITR
ncbi:MAG: YCF48-related protein [Candidatus Kapaibacterium sp.]